MDLPVNTDLDRVPQPGSHLVAWGENLHLPEEDNLLVLLAVADVFHHPDDGEGGQLVGVDQVVEAGEKHSKAATELAITEKQSEPMVTGERE